MQFPEGQGEGDGRSYVKLKDKESIKGVFRGSPKIKYIHWQDGKGDDCAGQGCQLCASGNKKSFRFLLNMVVKDESGGYVAKVLEQGWTVYNQLRDLNVEYPLESNIVKVTRAGSGKNDTSYTILPIPNGVVTKEIEAKISAVKLYDFDEPVQAKSPPKGDTPPPHTDEDIPF